MNYAALTVDELASRCTFDAEARTYAGEHFRELTDQLEEEWRAQFYADYEEAVDQAAANMLDRELERIAPWYDLTPSSPYWNIG